MPKEITIELERISDAADIFGDYDENIKSVENAFGVKIVCRDGSVKIAGDCADIEPAAEAVKLLAICVKKGANIGADGVSYIISMLQNGKGDELRHFIESDSLVCVSRRGGPVKAKTPGQKAYVEKIQNNAITFGVGPAGTGKTYLATALAIDAYRRRAYKRIILTRPAVEAGEQLGFLPGDLQQKIDPYLRPLYDAVLEMIDGESFSRMRERGGIEVVPLAYMRGRTLNDSFIILDEAQNTTCEQMKMFLTRLGPNSKAVIIGDLTQVDLPGKIRSGLDDAVKLLRDIPDIAIAVFDESDIVRNGLIRRIVRAYERGGKAGKGSINDD